MIEQLPEKFGPLLGFQFIGEITDEDCTEVFLPALRRAIKRFGVIRLLIDITDIQSEGFGAMGEDLKEESRVLYIEREAIIGDEDWEMRLADVDHFFIFPNADVRFFRENIRQDAWDWIREGMPQVAGM